MHTLNGLDICSLLAALFVVLYFRSLPLSPKP